MELVKKAQKFSFSFSQFRYGPFGFNPRQFRQDVTNFSHPEIFLPRQRDVTTFPLHYGKGLVKTNKVMKDYVTFSSTFLFLTSRFLLCPFPSLKPRAFPIA